MAQSYAWYSDRTDDDVQVGVNHMDRRRNNPEDMLGTYVALWNLWRHQSKLPRLGHPADFGHRAWPWICVLTAKLEVE